MSIQMDLSERMLEFGLDWYIAEENETNKEKAEVTNLEALKNYIIKELIHRGYTVQHYSAKSTDSHYIKVDYGLGYSIRISDHPGRKHLKYRYNVLSDLDDAYMIEERRQVFYPPKKAHIDHLLRQIDIKKKERMMKLGETGYKNYMANNACRFGMMKGFWQECETLTPKMLETA